MANTIGFRRMKIRKQKRESHYCIWVDACGNGIKANTDRHELIRNNSAAFKRVGKELQARRLNEFKLKQEKLISIA